MTGFTSGKRDQLGLPPANHDREPYHGPAPLHVRHKHPVWATSCIYEPGCTYDPRPEFDVAENQVLALYRQSGLSAGHWLSAILLGNLSGLYAPEVLNQARRVLHLLNLPRKKF